MVYELKDKIAFITGAASGIGFTCAQEILKAGAYAVAIADIDEANGEAAKKELIKKYGPERVLFIKTDVTKRDQFENAFKETLKQWKYVDILINNAAIFSDKRYELEIATNATAVVHGTLIGFQHMSKDKGGKGGAIVNMSSIVGLEPNFCYPVLVATKHFVLGFSRSMGTPYYYNRTGVKVVIICPGFTVTPLTNNLPSLEYLFPELKQHFDDKSQSTIWQPPTKVAECVITSIKEGETGSVWVCEANEIYEVKIPDRKTVFSYFLVMVYELKEKTVFITGAASGIGFICAKEFLKAGANAVAIVDIDEANGKSAKEELIKEYGPGRVLFIKTDVTKRDQFENAFKETLRQWKYVDILINNAGIFSDKSYELEIATNATAVVHGSLIALQYMGKDKGGKGGVIVNMSSIIGLEKDSRCPVLAGTKHFVIGLSRSLGSSYYYSHTGVKIISMCPGFTVTPMTNDPPSREFLFPGLKQVFTEACRSIPWQSPNVVAECVIKSIQKGENGSVWVVEGSEYYEVVLPDRKTLRK
ncbi:hypothetical protein ILUMI_24057 [Ignelater luminosus]|uniref:Alcohol dehydrogenase n=1 Tax=Ignelater luminosus TaxID=2038154 RepID=A0A8K0FWP9_IGNLU|nr:hypothetical protein ILUMI_24057 [Ignelater luminosus]